VLNPVSGEQQLQNASMSFGSQRPYQRPVPQFLFLLAILAALLCEKHLTAYFYSSM
jgi:hypothetical protein